MTRWNNIFSGTAPQDSPAASHTTIQVDTPQESLGSQFGHAAEAATTALGRQLQSMAKEVAGKSGVLGVASTAVAAGLASSGRFLEGEGFQGVVKNVAESMKRNPIPFLLVGIGLGYLAGRSRKSNES